VIVLGLDPGKITGVGLWHTDVLAVRFQAPADEAMDWVTDTLALYQRSDTPIHVACERFTVTQATVTKGGDAHHSLEQIGVYRYLARRMDHSFELHGASDCKKFTSDDRLRALGWYTPTKGGHTNDSLRVLAKQLADLKDPKFLELLAAAIET
jgi:DNA-directed RNA polymerase subunit N (RpoN/RPB10)